MASRKRSFEERRIYSYIKNPPSTASTCTVSHEDYNTRVHVSIHRDNKMMWIPSINSDPYLNPYCLKSVTSPADNVICTRCYAFNLLEGRLRSETVGSLKQPPRSKHQAIMQRPLGNHNFPIIKHAGLVRYNSFGELMNLQHLENLCDICSAYNGQDRVLPQGNVLSFYEAQRYCEEVLEKLRGVPRKHDTG